MQILCMKNVCFFSQETLQIYERPRAFKRENQPHRKTANRAKMNLCNSRNILKMKVGIIFSNKVIPKIGWMMIMMMITQSFDMCSLNSHVFEVVVRALIA